MPRQSKCTYCHSRHVPRPWTRKIEPSWETLDWRAGLARDGPSRVFPSKRDICTHGPLAVTADPAGSVTYPTSAGRVLSKSSESSTHCGYAITPSKRKEIISCWALSWRRVAKCDTKVSRRQLLSIAPSRTLAAEVALHPAIPIPRIGSTKLARSTSDLTLTHASEIGPALKYDKRSTATELAFTLWNLEAR